MTHNEIVGRCIICTSEVWEHFDPLARHRWTCKAGHNPLAIITATGQVLSIEREGEER